MEAQELELKILESVSECADSTGWANLAEVGAKLRSKEVKYGKLKKFLSKFSHILEFQMDEEVQPPVAYVKKKQTVPEPA